MEPGGREPAPGDLRIVQAFVNSSDIEAGRDELANQELLSAWLSKQGLLREEEPVTEDDYRRALDFREAIRELLLVNNGESVDPAATAILSDIANSARLVMRFDTDGRARLDSDAHGVDGALARILALAFAAMMDKTWARLKACRNNACQWAFYDRSKNRSGAWCTMAVCGNRMKARLHRLRKQFEESANSSGESTTQPSPISS